MPTNSAIIIIPARYASTRFPGKPLALLAGKPIIQHVYERASLSGGRVVVATDDERIHDCVASFSGEVVMTGGHHRSGTDRCIEAYHIIGRGEEVLINLQGDEPFVSCTQVATLIEALADNQADIATLAEVFAPATPDSVLFDPNIVKLVRSQAGDALYFSRSVIPHIRGVERNFCQEHQYYKHIGLYGFRTSILGNLSKLSTSSLEHAESLEQLRWLEAGYRVRVELANASTIGIDTPEDLERAEEYIRRHHSDTL